MTRVSSPRRTPRKGNTAATLSGRWVLVDQALPLLGRPVPVRGEYTPAGYGYPVSRLRRDPAEGVRWDSIEWRGICGVTAWFDTGGSG